MAEKRIDSVMRTEFPTLRLETPIREAVALFVDTGWAAAPVVDEKGALVGIMSQKDCFRSALNAGYYRQWSGTVAEHHAGAVEALDVETDIVTAAQAFIEQPFRAYPVTRHGLLVGMLNREDLLRAFLDFG
jgi:CBS domain-containing protein